MAQEIYEPHSYENPNFPVIFHYDVVQQRSWNNPPHWHENIEILYVMEGSPLFVIDAEEVVAQPGEFIVVPSNALHQINSATRESRYYCLIIDRDFCSRFGFDFHMLSLQRHIRDLQLSAAMNAVVREFKQKEPYYQTAILSSILSLLVRLVRVHLAEPPLSQSDETRQSQLETIKQIFTYIDRNYQKNLTTDELAQAVGFSKYYVCHLFKELTSVTPVGYINYVRCKKAKQLLASGRCNVGETASLCGFDNLSYFSRTYRRYMGELPSRTLRQS